MSARSGTSGAASGKTDAAVSRGVDEEGTDFMPENTKAWPSGLFQQLAQNGNAFTDLFFRNSDEAQAQGVVARRGAGIERRPWNKRNVALDGLGQQLCSVDVLGQLYPNEHAALGFGPADRGGKMLLHGLQHVTALLFVEIAHTR